VLHVQVLQQSLGLRYVSDHGTASEQSSEPGVGPLLVLTRRDRERVIYVQVLQQSGARLSTLDSEQLC
jgi:hypothetical protein